MSNQVLSTLQTLLKGFGNSFLIALLSLIFPLAIGIVLTIFSSKFSVANKIFSWLSLPFECLCPIFWCSALYFILNGVLPSKIRIYYNIWTPIIAVIVLSVCFIGYMPARCVESYSATKNILYNGLGLVKNICMWSFFVSGCSMMNTDLYKAGLTSVSLRYDPYIALIPLVISIILLFVLELARRLIKQFMK